MKKTSIKHRLLSPEQVSEVLGNAQNNRYHIEYDADKQKAIIRSNEEENGNISLRLPINFTFETFDRLPTATDTNFIILLIQSGSAALGFFENDVNLDHKVFKSYMVRKKQGKSQIKHLKSKGKSKAGSRVRLANTIDFFENINERLAEYEEDYSIDRIAMSCSKILIPFLFNAKMPCPFDKKDERIYKVPKHIHTPSFDILMQTHEFLMKGEISYEEDNESTVESLLEDLWL